MHTGERDDDHAPAGSSSRPLSSRAAHALGCTAAPPPLAESVSASAPASEAAGGALDDATGFHAALMNSSYSTDLEKGRGPRISIRSSEPIT